MKSGVLYVALFVSNILLAQVTFEASVSKKTLGVNERLRIDFKMNRPEIILHLQAFKTSRL